MPPLMAIKACASLVFLAKLLPLLVAAEAEPSNSPLLASCSSNYATVIGYQSLNLSSQFSLIDSKMDRVKPMWYGPG